MGSMLSRHISTTVLSVLEILAVHTDNFAIVVNTDQYHPTVGVGNGSGHFIGEAFSGGNSLLSSIVESSPRYIFSVSSVKLSNIANSPDEYVCNAVQTLVVRLPEYRILLPGPLLLGHCQPIAHGFHCDRPSSGKTISAAPLTTILALCVTTITCRLLFVSRNCRTIKS